MFAGCCLPSLRRMSTCMTFALVLSLLALLSFSAPRAEARALTNKAQGMAATSAKVTASSPVITCTAMWLQNQVASINQSLNKSRDLVNAAANKATASQFASVRNLLARCQDQIYNAGQYLQSRDFTKARKRVESLRTNLQACQTAVASASKGASWTEIAQALSATSLIPSQCITISQLCKSGTTASPSGGSGTPPPPPPSTPKAKSPPFPPPKARPSPPITPQASPPPPPPMARPPPAVATKSDADSNSTVVDINYEAYGWKPYGKNGGNWSNIIHATFYGNDEGNNTYGQCYGNTPTNISSQYLGVYTAAGSKVLLQLGVECGACYEIKCADSKLCITQSPVTVRLTNACPKSTGTGYPWCDFPRIHFDMSKPAFSAITNPKVGAVQIQYRRVDCPVVGDVAYYISSKGHRWWIPINILNVGGAGAVSDMWFRTSNTSAWVSIERSWGANWSIHQKPYLVGKAVSFRLKLRGTQQFVVSENVLPANWTFGATYVGGQFQTDDSDLMSAAGPSGSDASS